MLKKIFPLALIFSFLITSGLGCKGISQEEQNAIKPITLNYWRVIDEQDSFGEIIQAYNALHPNISINYKKLRTEDLESSLLNAMAEDRGPDMFSIPNTWLRAYQSKIYPLPASLKVAYQSVQGTYQKKTVVTIKNTATPSAKNIQDTYISDVGNNVIIPTLDPATNQYSKMVYGLPLSVDTLVLYYNKDLLDLAGIASPPQTWSDFQKDVIALAKIDQNNDIIRAGAAIGTSKNVDRSADILALLMMQNGVVMANDNGSPTFNQVPAGWSGSTPPAEQALQFYTDFAQPTKQVYTWNNKISGSLDAFVRGQAAFFIGYGYHQGYIKARAPKLNYNLAAIPQVNLEAPTNFASYWLETVSKKTKYPNEAWDFILFANKAENVVKYLNKTGKVAALRELISSEKENPDLAVLAGQLLTAKSWYKGQNVTAAEKYFNEMIDTVLDEKTLNDTAIYNKVVNSAAGKIQQTIYATSQ